MRHENQQEGGKQAQFATQRWREMMKVVSREYKKGNNKGKRRKFGAKRQ